MHRVLLCIFRVLPCVSTPKRFTVPAGAQLDEEVDDLYPNSPPALQAPAQPHVDSGVSDVRLPPTAGPSRCPAACSRTAFHCALLASQMEEEIAAFVGWEPEDHGVPIQPIVSDIADQAGALSLLLLGPQGGLPSQCSLADSRGACVQAHGAVQGSSGPQGAGRSAPQDTNNHSGWYIASHLPREMQSRGRPQCGH